MDTVSGESRRITGMTIYDELVCEAYAKFKLLFGYYKQDRESITMYFLLLDNMK